MNLDQYSSAFPKEDDGDALDRALEDTFPASDTLDLMPRRRSIAAEAAPTVSFVRARRVR
jgi:hypothetical protein